MSFTVVALYKFTKLVDPKDTKRQIDVLCLRYNILGALIMAHEGINGTISGPSETIQDFVSSLRQIIPIQEHELKFSTSENNPFYRMRTMIKPEIITMGCEDVDPQAKNGTYVDSQQWNQLLDDPNVLLIGMYSILLLFIHSSSNMLLIIIYRLVFYIQIHATHMKSTSGHLKERSIQIVSPSAIFPLMCRQH